jgi:hypothetical protein
MLPLSPDYLAPSRAHEPVRRHLDMDPRPVARVEVLLLRWPLAVQPADNEEFGIEW